MVKLILLTATSLLLSFSLPSQTGKVLFKVTDIQTDLGGSISSGIFTKENFPKVGKRFRGEDLTVTSNEMEVLLEDVPVATYGAVVFQDKNDNRKLETNLLGFPKEPIGFANNAKIRLGPPSFEDASITVVEGETVIVNIQLK